MGQWIILTSKLPTVVSPPKLSIFYAVAWPMTDYAAKEQLELYAGEGGYWNSDEGVTINPQLANQDYFFDEAMRGKEPNMSKGLKIRYKGEDIRVWAHECNVLTPERLEDYLKESHVMVSQNSGAEVLKGMFNDSQSEFRLIFDAAILDGASYVEALFVALGADIETPPDIMTDIFWFKVRPEYGSIFCIESELEETDRRPTISIIPKVNPLVDKYLQKVTPEIRKMLDRLKRLSRARIPEHNPDSFMNKYQDLALDIAELLEVDEDDVEEFGESTTALIEQLARIQ